ncbi:MAG: GNAT family N-acetyltransferase [Bacteroidia bacterium]|nr:GNAT family N-acetyltransferase [Bacteroidia bacterium]
MAFPIEFTLASQNLTLRAPREEDIPHIFSATRYPGFNDGMQWAPPESMGELFPNLHAHIEAWKKAEAFGFVITERESEKFLGRISLRPTQDTGTWDIGYWTHPENQRKGIMTEAIGRVLQFAEEELKAKDVVAAYATWNKASQRVLEKNGFIYLKHLPKGFKKKGKWVPENLMIHKFKR